MVLFSGANLKVLHFRYPRWSQPYQRMIKTRTGQATWEKKTSYRGLRANKAFPNFKAVFVSKMWFAVDIAIGQNRQEVVAELKINIQSHDEAQHCHRRL